MRSMFRSVLLAVVAALAMSGAASASALASEQWYENGVAVKEPKPVTFEGTMTVKNHRGVENEEFTCSLSGKGTVSKEGKGTVTEYNMTKCTVPPTAKCEEGQPLTVTALHLPWSTQLVTTTIEGIHNKIGASGLSPVWHWECLVNVGGFKFKFTDKCEGFAESQATNEEAGTKVIESFKGLETTSIEMPCEKEGRGLLHGTNKLKATGGATLTIAP